MRAMRQVDAVTVLANPWVSQDAVGPGYPLLWHSVCFLGCGFAELYVWAILGPEREGPLLVPLLRLGLIAWDTP